MWTWRPANSRRNPRCIRVLVRSARLAIIPNSSDREVAIVTTPSAATAVEKANLRNWVAVWILERIALRVPSS